jgi:sugar O-acyltransferase (sialic acid O-acetyltransferase NeuD family)
VKKVVIFGAGGHAVSVANVVIASGAIIECFIDPKKNGQELLGLKIVANAGSFSSLDVCYVVAIGDNLVREKMIETATAKIPKDRFINFIHPTASVGINAKLGYGNVVMPHATIGPSSVLEDFCIINTNSSIDHDCVMKSFSSLAPGAHAGGNVTIGQRSSISIGAIVKHGIVIGDDAVIGAASYVDKDVLSNSVVYGVPAKFVRPRLQDDLFLR